MEKKIAYLGAGNMGGALLRAACQVLPLEKVFVADSMHGRAAALAEELGCQAAADNLAAIAAADVILFCVKPQIMPAALREAAPLLQEALAKGQPKLVVSIAAGITIASIHDYLGLPAQPVLRIMPNTAALVNNALYLLASDGSATEEAKAEFAALLSHSGAVSEISEALIDAGTVLSGSSPAFAYMFIEAMADGAVKTGLPRDRAIEYAAHAVAGAAAMVLQTGLHPGALKDMVCSPAGSTIAGVATLEAHGFRGAVIEAVEATYRRNGELGKQ